MANIEHKDLGGVGAFGTAVGAAVSGNHGIDVAATASQATRFALTPLVSDVGKVIKQTDTGTYWLLADHTLVGSAAGWRQVVFPQHAGAADVGKALIATASDVAFGTNFGTQNLVTSGFISLGVNPAASGQLRLPNNTGISFRNAANSGDVGVVYVDTGNNVSFGGTGFNTNLSALTTLAFSLAGGQSLTYGITSFQHLRFASGFTATIHIATAGVTAGSLLSVIGQDTSSTAGATAGAVLVKGGSCTGASGSRTGGNCDMQPGAGATAGGQARMLNAAGVARVAVNDTGLGFFAVAPVAQPADTGALTASFGTADGTVADVTAIHDQTILNNNFQDLATKINAIRTALRALGLMA